MGLIEDDVCDGFDCGDKGGSCVQTATGPRCECGDSGYTGPKCMDPIIVDEKKKPTVVINETLEELKLQQQIRELANAKNKDFDYNKSVNAVNLNVSVCTFSVNGDTTGCNSTPPKTAPMLLLSRMRAKKEILPTHL